MSTTTPPKKPPARNRDTRTQADQPTSDNQENKPTSDNQENKPTPDHEPNPTSREELDPAKVNQGH